MSFNNIPIYSGFEPTMLQMKEKGEHCIDVLQTTEHSWRFEDDLLLVQKAGIKKLRVAFPWHIIESRKGIYDWTWMDRYVARCNELGIGIIADPLHHVSIPAWLEDGFLDEQFVSAYIDYFAAIVYRYPQVEDYTIVNEPLVTTYFACEVGIWLPFATGEANFQKGLDNIVKIIVTCSKLLEFKGKRHIYIDACEYHYGTCDTASEHACKKNDWRFTLLDRILDKGVHIDVLGLDYYAHSEFEWCEEGRTETNSPIGFYNIAKDYYTRYKIPLALTETNIRGFISDRQTWFKAMYKQLLKLEEDGIPIEFFVWYPFSDSADWDSLLRECNRNIDPVGIVWLNKNFDRNESDFSDNIGKLNRGEITIDDVAEYDYLPPLDNQLKGFKTLN